MQKSPSGCLGVLGGCHHVAIRLLSGSDLFLACYVVALVSCCQGCMAFRDELR